MATRKNSRSFFSSHFKLLSVWFCLSVTVASYIHKKKCSHNIFSVSHLLIPRCLWVPYLPVFFSGVNKTDSLGFFVIKIWTNIFMFPNALKKYQNYRKKSRKFSVKCFFITSESKVQLYVLIDQNIYFCTNRWHSSEKYNFPLLMGQKYNFLY